MAATDLRRALQLGIDRKIGLTVAVGPFQPFGDPEIPAGEGVARGHAVVRFGGARGRNIRLKAGDVIVQPAGTGHQRISASRDLLVVGAYPGGKDYDMCRANKGDHDRALAAIAKTTSPRTDPVYGGKGPLKDLWR